MTKGGWRCLNSSGGARLAAVAARVLGVALAFHGGVCRSKQLSTSVGGGWSCRLEGGCRLDLQRVVSQTSRRLSQRKETGGVLSNLRRERKAEQEDVVRRS